MIFKADLARQDPHNECIIRLRAIDTLLITIEAFIRHQNRRVARSYMFQTVNKLSTLATLFRCSDPLQELSVIRLLTETIEIIEESISTGNLPPLTLQISKISSVRDRMVSGLPPFDL